MHKAKVDLLLLSLCSNPVRFQMSAVWEMYTIWTLHATNPGMRRDYATQLVVTGVITLSLTL